EPPNALEQHGAREHAAFVAHKDLEQPELARLQADDVAAPCYLACDEIYLEIGEPQYGLGVAQVRAARQRIYASHEFGEGEGFGQIIVSAHIETIDAVVDATERRQEQHRHLVPNGA